MSKEEVITVDPESAESRETLIAEIENLSSEIRARLRALFSRREMPELLKLRFEGCLDD